MLVWKHKVECNTYIDYSEVIFFLSDGVAKVGENQQLIINCIVENPHITAANVAVIISYFKQKGRREYTKTQRKWHFRTYWS